MAIPKLVPREAYKMLEAVVGPENISEDPAVVDGYVWQYGAEWLGDPKVGTKFLPYTPGAVVLPKTTEEVQGILKVCNRFKLMSKAFSTGWGHKSSVSRDGAIQIDLRRMNRILDIDEKNMIAVIEPYVCGAQLVAELWKRGLNFNIIGAGPNCSILASVTSMMGIGYNNLSMGYNDRNALGVEWVLPTGDVLRLGSLGSGAGWICGDGPGPSLRGIMRATMGAMGGLGVFTKCAIKLYHWAGEATLPIRAIGEAPRYTWEEGAGIPENMDIIHLSFPNLEKVSDAIWKMGEAEIGYAAGSFDRYLMMLGTGRYNADRVMLIENDIPDILPKYAFTLLLVCNSREQLEYERKVRNEIIASCGGEIYRLEPEIQSFLFLLMLQGSSLPTKFVFGQTGSFHPTLVGNFVTRHTLGPAHQISWDMKKPYAEKGLILSDKGEGGWGCSMDYSHVAYLENESMYNPNDLNSGKAWLEMSAKTNKEVVDKHLFFPIYGQRHIAYPKSTHEYCGPFLHNYHIWQKKVKEALDPNTASDPETYV